VFAGSAPSKHGGLPVLGEEVDTSPYPYMSPINNCLQRKNEFVCFFFSTEFCWVYKPQLRAGHMTSSGRTTQTVLMVFWCFVVAV